MEATTIREKLHQYIDSSDEKLIKMMFAMAKEYNEDDELDYDFTEDIKILDERRQKRLSGESSTHSWEEVKKSITDRKNR
jgi:hypothetical protein